MSLISDNRKPSNVKYMVSCRCNPGRALVQLLLSVTVPVARTILNRSRRASLTITIY